MYSPTDTIVALATAPAPAGLGVVRISGPGSQAVARALLTVPHDLQPRHATLTRVVAGPRRAGDGAAEGPARDDPSARDVSRPIDEVVATFFPGPHSYTAEDVVEISAHGSLELLRAIVGAAMDAGARLAEPGEFTLRAFLNGRLDLVQAEAVGDLVAAVTPLQARVAFDQLEGTLTRAIGALDAELFELAAKLEASVDFPDEGYRFAAPGDVAATLARVRDGVSGLLATAARGRLIREGRHIAILGKPNVGKSSLFNELVGIDRAIVNATPGTTRDVLRETIDFEGIRLGLVDTAGLRATEDEVEREGVARARKAGDVADLVLVVLDRSRPLEDEDWALLADTAGLRRVVIVNKCDLEGAWAGSPDPVSGRPGRVPSTGHERGANQRRERLVTGVASSPPWQEGMEFAGGQGPGRSAETQKEGSGGPRLGAVEVSLKTGAGREELRQAMRAALGAGAETSGGQAPRGAGLGPGEPLRDAPVVTNLRHANLLEEARGSLDRAIENLEAAGGAASEELVIADIAVARRAFEEVTGRRTTDDVLHQIFERFCVGK